MRLILIILILTKLNNLMANFIFILMLLVIGYLLVLSKALKAIEVKKSLDAGANLYFSLWNFEIEKCEFCGFASKDISIPLNFEIDKAEVEKILNNETLIEFFENRPHKIFDYLIASIYYKASGDILNQALCVLQAGDLFYTELMYFADDVLDGIQDEEVKKLNKIGEKDGSEKVTTNLSLYKKASYAF